MGAILYDVEYEILLIKEDSWERKIWKAVLIRSLRDIIRDRTTRISDLDRKEALRWFKSKSLKPGGWYFVADILELPNSYRQKIDQFIVSCEFKEIGLEEHV